MISVHSFGPESEELWRGFRIGFLYLIPSLSMISG